MIESYIRNILQEEMGSRLEMLKADLQREIKTNEKPYLRKIEAAEYLCVCQSTIDNYVRDGRLNKYKIGRKSMFKKAELDNLLV